MIPLFITVMLSGVSFPKSMGCAMSVFDKSLGGTAGSVVGVITFLLSAIGSMAISHIHPTSQTPWAVAILILMAVNWIFIIMFYAFRKRYSYPIK